MGDLPVVLSHSLAGYEVQGKAIYTSVLNAATGDEYAFRIDYTVNKATSGDDYGLRINQTDTASPGTSYLAWFGVGGSMVACIGNTGKIVSNMYGGSSGTFQAGNDANRGLAFSGAELQFMPTTTTLRVAYATFICEGGEASQTTEAFKFRIRTGKAHTSGLLYNLQHLEGDSYLSIDFEGKIGIGTNAPVNSVSISGQAAKVVSLLRHATADTAGNSLTIRAGSATALATNKAGGDVIVTPGLSTGTGESGVQIQGVPAGGSGTGDGTPATKIQVLGDKLGFHGVTPIVRAVLATGAGATVDNVITALQNLGLVKQS